AAFLPSAVPVTARSKSITAILLAPAGEPVFADEAAGFAAGLDGAAVAGGVFAGAALVGAGVAGVCACNVAASNSVVKISELARFILIASDSRDSFKMSCPP